MKAHNFFGRCKLASCGNYKDLDELWISGELEGDNASAEKFLLVLKQ